jgi:YegS/Rv2252/BmrU family lipid kinase
MRKTILLYNPLAGSRRQRRVADIEAAMAILRSAGVEVTAEATGGSGDDTAQTRRAIADGCDTVFACGGDGTIHDVLQGLVGSQTALGIIPLGTANALAHDLGLPLSPAAAARASLTATPRRIAVGRVTYQKLSGGSGSRYFTVTVGVGADAHLFYKLDPLVKNRIGMAAYYAKATLLWLTLKLEHLAVEILDEGGEQPRRAEVSQLLAVRIREFGGILRELAPGASLERNDLRLVLFKTRSRLAYLRYILRGLFGARWEVTGIDLLHSTSVKCCPLPASGNSSTNSRIFVEADGELLGTLPAEISLVPDALTLLFPSGYGSQLSKT